MMFYLAGDIEMVLVQIRGNWVTSNVLAVLVLESRVPSCVGSAILLSSR